MTYTYNAMLLSDLSNLSFEEDTRSIVGVIQGAIGLADADRWMRLRPDLVEFSFVS